MPLIRRSKLMRRAPVQLKVIEIGEAGYHIFLETLIGTATIRWVLDTGCSTTLVDSAFAAQYPAHVELLDHAIEGNSISTTISMTTGHVHLMEFGWKTIRDIMVGVTDLDYINQHYLSLGIGTIQGVLGSDILVQLSAEIDLKRKLLKVS